MNGRKGSFLMFSMEGIEDDGFDENEKNDLEVESREEPKVTSPIDKVVEVRVNPSNPVAIPGHPSPKQKRESIVINTPPKVEMQLSTMKIAERKSGYRGLLPDGEFEARRHILENFFSRPRIQRQEEQNQREEDLGLKLR